MSLYYCCLNLTKANFYANKLFWKFKELKRLYYANSKHWPSGKLTESLRYPSWRIKIWTNDKWSIDRGTTALSGSQGIADHQDIVLSTHLTSVFCSKLGRIFILKLWYVTANRVRQSKIQRGEKLNSFEILVFVRKRTLKFLQVEDVLLITPTSSSTYF